ncbi:MAG: lysophospholipase L1-like esterase [Candidatus Omnitrophota bacterium]|jgi:lysophospholipase L1-like esterase
MGNYSNWIRILLTLFVFLPLPGWSEDESERILRVDDTAFYFSPGNWVGDAGRGGRAYRQAWNAGAYFRVSWESTNASSAITLLLDTHTYPDGFKPPRVVCNIDGRWSEPFHPHEEEVVLTGPESPGRHVLTGYLASSTQDQRWGSEGVSGVNVLRIKGVRLSAGSQPSPAVVGKKWALIVGDSLTEGVGVKELEGWSSLVGQGLQELAFEYGISACGWSGWQIRGDQPPGDVPAYYKVTGSVAGAGGTYLDAESRWNKIDANHALLDSEGHLSGHGTRGQEPALVLINYGTNDILHNANVSDVEAGIALYLEDLRRAAPRAHIVFIIPFGRYKAEEIYRVVKAYQATHPSDQGVAVIDLGPAVSHGLAAGGFWGGLHPNARGHATFAARIMARIASMPGL